MGLAHHRGLAVAVILGAGFLLGSRIVVAQPPPGDAKQRAGRLLDDGVSRFRAGDLETALARFQAAYDLYPSPKILLNLGEVLRALGREPAAAEAYDRFLVETAGAPEVSAERLRQAQKALQELNRRLARLQLEPQLANATVTMDGQPLRPRPGRPLYLTPGTHRINIAAPGYVVATVTVEVAAGEERQVRLSLAAVPTGTPATPPADSPATAPAPATPRRPLLWTWVAAGTTVALAVGGVVAGVRARSAFADYRSTTDPQRYDQLRSEVAHSSAAANALFATAGAAAIATGLIYFLLERPRRAERRVTLVPAAPGGLGLAVGGRY